jgi:hypothetical protein
VAPCVVLWATLPLTYPWSERAKPVRIERWRLMLCVWFFVFCVLCFVFCVELEGFRQIDSFIVVCEQLIVYAQ